MRDAADVLAPVKDDVVVIGATALEAALAGKDTRATATTDVDCGVRVDSAARVIAELERAGLRQSEVAHERDFTWVRDDLKVQLIRPPARTVAPPVALLVTNTQLGLADKFREPVAFNDDPGVYRLWVATPAAVLALKGHAFGRTRPDSGLVERDYHDSYLLVEFAGDEIAVEFNSTDDGQLRGLIRRALDDLGSAEARAAVRNQATRLDARLSPREAQADLVRAIERLRGKLGSGLR